MKTALLILAAAAASAPSQQFDLICTGTPGNDGALVYAGADLRLRVDLAAGKWCEDDCRVINPIVEQQPAMLWLEKASEIEQRREQVHVRAVNRETGQYLRIQESRFGQISERGQCQRAPFSGFPKIETKF
jgi:hypothetical protein